MRQPSFPSLVKQLVPQLSCYPSPGKSLYCKLSTATSSTDHPRYKHIDDVEPLDNYRIKGYHPIRIGDFLHKRYRIVHKLGHGSYSTIWLARDDQLSSYVAVKVGTAASNHQEIDILNHLNCNTFESESPGRALIPPILDRFDIHGPNGTHPCFVTIPAACSLADAKSVSEYVPFQTDVARSLAAQLAMAVAYMHRAGFVHGDLHFGNLLLQRLASIDGMTDQQLYDQYDYPDPEPVMLEDDQPPSSPGVPSHVYAPIWMGKSSKEISLGEAKLLLTDLGTAFSPDEESRFHSYTPLELRPPEARFEPAEPLTFASDVWSLGCMIWAILGVKPFLGAWLFGPESATASQIDALGPMPNAWWDKWDSKTKTKQFDGNGRPSPGRTVRTFEQRFEDSIQEPRRERSMELIADDEREALFEMIRGMLKYSPRDRMTASQVLDTRWMRNWAIPEARKSWGMGDRTDPTITSL